MINQGDASARKHATWSGDRKLAIVSLAGRVSFREVEFPNFYVNVEDDIMTTASGHTSAIRAKKVIGTNVEDNSGRKIGKVEDVVLDKQSDRIMFAVVGFGGFLGMGEKYHPIPWSSLDYSETDDAYVVPYTEDQLRDAPAGSIDELTREGGIAVRNRAFDYYKAPHYWE